MENLPQQLSQRDQRTYMGMTPAGSARYEGLHLTGKAIAEGEIHPRGFSADDFNVFATMVFAFADNKNVFDAIHQQGKSIRHIDVGTGPNLYTFIASIPYADELISIDLASANTQKLDAIAKKREPVASHWQSWLEIAAIIYDIGSAESLVALDQESPELYDKLRNWSTLKEEEKNMVRTHIRKRDNNPYTDIDLREALHAKLKPHTGDILDDIYPLEQFNGTAQILTENFLSESITSQLAIAAHAKTNSIQLAESGALVISAHISKTTGYTGFFSSEELEADPTRSLEELPGTPALFETIVGEVVDLSDKYRQLWERLEEGSESRKMVRPESPYGSAVILCGKANYRTPDGSIKYNNGQELIYVISDRVRTVTVGNSTMHCTTAEVGRIAGDLINDFCPRIPIGNHEIPVFVASPS